jgi:putative ABC transport system permease protein
MTNLLTDLRYAWRTLLKSPGFSLVAVVVLALGIGANTAIFSVVNAVLLRPLPYPEADRLMRVWHTPPQKAFPGMTQFSVSPANYLDWEGQNHVFESMAIYGYRGFNLTGSGEPERLIGAAVSAHFFSTVRVQPLLGRVFTEDENQAGRGDVVVLSHSLWKSHFGSDPGIVGRNIHLNDKSYLVAGVMSANMVLPGWAQLWTPMAWTDQQRAVRGNHNYMVIARLRPGVSEEQAQSEMNTISSRLEQQYPEDDKGWGAVVLPLQRDMVSDVRPALLVLLGAVAAVLLIACANVANMVLAKTFERRKEMAIRAALGASRGRVLSRVLSETVLLAGMGGALGLVVAHFANRLIVAYLADQLPKSVHTGLDLRVLLFTLFVSLLTGVMAGLVPAMRMADANPNDALKQGLGRTDASAGGRTTRNVLVVAEVALSLVLLIGAGLMIRSLSSLHGVDPGFETQSVATMSISVPATKFADATQQTSFYEQVLQHVRAMPGVQAVGLVDNLPLSGGGSHEPISIEGQPVLPMSEQPEVDVRIISAGYMSAMRTPIVRGREFNDSDVMGRPAVALISQSMANRFWPNQEAIGKHLTIAFEPSASREIIGIVKDVKLDALNETQPNATLYTPITQLYPEADAAWRSFGMTLVARAQGNPNNLVTSITNAIHQVDPDRPVLDVKTMEDVVAESLTPQRFNMLLLAAFAGLALLLAAVGIYSVLAYAVRQRVREIGLRMALGAQIGDVLRLVVVEGLKPTIVGLVIGILGALALGRVLSSMIFGVSTRDVTTYASVSVLLVGAALGASLIPAWRATKVDPIRSLRDE